MIVEVEPARGAQLDDDRAYITERVAASNSTGETFFTQYAGTIAACAAAMADRFFAGATLFIFGTGPHATDAQHNAVEFVHPVLPGCRALPALSLINDIATVSGMLESDAAADVYAHQLRVLGRPGDIALGFAHAPLHESIARGLEAGASGDMLTIALTSGDIDAHEDLAEFALHVPGEDRSAAHELHLATYHMLWELVHIVLNHRGIGGERMTIECHDEVCITCSDQLLEVRVLAVDAVAGLAKGVVDGEPVEVGIELIDPVEVGDVLLCHGGVALQKGTLAEART